MAKTILIVDDSASFRQVVAITLKSAGYDVIEGCDGKDALEKIANKRVHLIISDVNMPNMDGIEFLKAVKQMNPMKYADDSACTMTWEERNDNGTCTANY